MYYKLSTSIQIDHSVSVNIRLKQSVSDFQGRRNGKEKKLG